jgi:Lrp/AsnC family leucine-responsive transcriptional regulator
MQGGVLLDATDIEIIKMLEQNGRISHEDIAQILHMSRPAIHKRIEKLENEGVIKGYRALIDWRMVSPCIRCLIFLKINGRQFDTIASNLKKLDIPGIVVEECLRMTGEWCVMVKARISAPEDTTRLLDRLWQLEGVMQSSTAFVISTPEL